MLIKIINLAARIGDTTATEEGPIQPEDPAKVPKEPYPLIAGFEWVTVDITDKSEVCTKDGDLEATLMASSWMTYVTF